MITDIETGIDNSTWNAQGYVKIYTDRPLGDDGTPESILAALAKHIAEDLERRELGKRKEAFRAKIEIYRAADEICDRYGVELKVEVSE